MPAARAFLVGLEGTIDGRVVIREVKPGAARHALSREVAWDLAMRQAKGGNKRNPTYRYPRAIDVVALDGKTTRVREAVAL